MSFINDLNKRGQQARAKWFEAFLKLLTRLKISANHITFFRGIVGPIFFFIYPIYPVFITWAMILAISLDWIDGALARFQNKDSDTGKFWDVLVDHTNYVFVVLTFMRFEQFDNIILGYHLLIVPILYLVATIKESEKVKTDWIIHPYYTIVYFKPFAAASLILYTFWQIDTINVMVFSLNIAMTLWTLYYVAVLIKRYKT